MTSKLRIVVFTAGEMTSINKIFFERLASDPSLDLAAIVVDEYQPRRKPLLKRVVRALREDGLGWLAFKIGSKVRAMVDRAVLAVADTIHGPRRIDADLPTIVHRLRDIHSPDSISLIQSLSPDLGVIVGGRILRDSVITIPKYGTLNIHKRKLPQYRGGGPVGYWEILAGERSIGVSIHFATREVDAGPVIAQETIEIEECDTLESLKLKADLRGAALYHDAIRRVAQGNVVAVRQDVSNATTYRAPSEYKVCRLQRRLERKAAAMSGLRIAWAVRLRVLAQYLLLLPYLLRVRRQLIDQRRVPVSIFFYHLVSNRPLNHLCLPLTVFARQVDFLRRYYTVLSLDETIERLRSGENREIAASITFDDGYRDNTWAIEYLRYFGVPATFFVSVGHVRDGSAFEHDKKRGYANALPMSESDVQQLVAAGFEVGSHGVHHEDFGSLTPERADCVLRESRESIEETCGRTPSSFAFPKGQRGTNITRETLALALNHFRHVFSAYGGYAFPQRDKRHFLRASNPTSVFDLSLAMTGYVGFRECLTGNAWGLKTEKLDPCGEETPKNTIALIAASPRITGGHSAQARALSTELHKDGHRVAWIPIDVRFPFALRWIRRVPYARTLLNEALYIPSLLRIARADIVHIFSASYWSFLLGPAPAMAIAKLMRKPVVLHYHSGEADDHLTRWRRVAGPFLRMADEIVVPSGFLQRIFASHGYSTRVIPNVVDLSKFVYRDRIPLQPRLLSTRNLEKYYRVDSAIVAFAKLKRRFPEATLTIAGHGSEERALQSLVDQLGVSGVRFVGSVASDEMPKLYDAADIFLNASVLDNQPVSILEAFASGLPVISTQAGDIPSMLRSGEAGLLVDSNDPAAMAAAVIRLLDEPQLALKLARRAREEAERYTWARAGVEWNTLYSELLSGTGGEVLAHGA